MKTVVNFVLALLVVANLAQAADAATDANTNANANAEATGAAAE